MPEKVFNVYSQQRTAPAIRQWIHSPRVPDTEIRHRRSTKMKFY
jgi:hypothetical protein